MLLPFLLVKYSSAVVTQYVFAITKDTVHNYTSLTKCKKEFGNCGKVVPGTMLLSMLRWPGWGETASIPPCEFTKADIGSDILYYS